MVPVKSFGRGISLRPQRLALPSPLKSLIPVLSRLPPGSHIYKPSLRLSKWYWSLSGSNSLRVTQHSCQKNQEVSPSHGGTVAHTTTKQGFLSLLSPRVLQFLWDSNPGINPWGQPGEQASHNQLCFCYFSFLPLFILEVTIFQPLRLSFANTQLHAFYIGSTGNTNTFIILPFLSP